METRALIRRLLPIRNVHQMNICQERVDAFVSALPLLGSYPHFSTAEPTARWIGGALGARERRGRNRLLALRREEKVFQKTRGVNRELIRLQLEQSPARSLRHLSHLGAFCDLFAENPHERPPLAPPPVPSHVS